jgi:signal transduction histidine kinase
LARHSAARKVHIKWKKRRTGWILLIKDDGNGFTWNPYGSNRENASAEIPFPGMGSGLKNILYRTKDIGARVRVFGIPGNGSLFVIVLR